MNQKQLYNLINETVRKALNEVEILPTNQVKNEYINKWRIMFNALSNIQENMKNTYNEREGRIRKQDYVEMLNYIGLTFGNFGIQLG